MGSSNTKEQKVESTPDIISIADLTLTTKTDITTWKENIDKLFQIKRSDLQKNMDAYLAEEEVMADPKTSDKKRSRRKFKNGPPIDPSTINRIDDSVRNLNIQCGRTFLAPKDANEIKRTLLTTSKLERIVVRDHFGGPGIGFRDEIASRVLLAVGKWFGESLSVTSFDISKNNIGGSTQGIDKRTNELLDPVYDTRKVGPSGSYLLQGLAESKLKRGVSNPTAIHREERSTKPMDRVVLKNNNLTHYGYYSRQVGTHLRSLLSNAGRIISLDLSSCYLGPDAAAKGFSKTIQGIERLNLQNNNLGGRWHYDGHWETDALFARELMRQLLDENCSLRSLDLSSNRLTTKQAEFIAKGLKGNGTLKSIVLAHNPDIGDDGCELLINSMDSEVSNLEMLDLRETGLGSMSIFILKKLYNNFNSKACDEHELTRNLVVDISVNNVNSNQLPENHGDSRVRFVTDSWRHLVKGRANVATLPQIRNLAIDFILNGTKFEKKFKLKGRLGLQLISSSACPDVVEQISSAVVSATIKGSPSQPRKGKRIAVGSLLTHINGVSTAGMTLAQTIERLKSVRSTRKQAWVDVEEEKKKKKKKKKGKKNQEVEEEIEIIPDPYADCMILKFMGRMSTGPPRLKRRKPGSRKAELERLEKLKQEEEQERKEEQAARKQYQDDLNAINGDTTLPRFTLDESKNKGGAGEDGETTTIEQLKEGWIETQDEWGTIYYWNIETNETSWEKPVVQITVPKTIKTKIKTISKNDDDDGALASLLRDTVIDDKDGIGNGEKNGGNGKRVSLLDLSNVKGKTQNEIDLELLLEKEEEEERAKKIHDKMLNDSKVSHTVSINKKTRGKRQSKKFVDVNQATKK